MTAPGGAISQSAERSVDATSRETALQLLLALPLVFVTTSIRVVAVDSLAVVAPGLVVVTGPLCSHGCRGVSANAGSLCYWW